MPRRLKTAGFLSRVLHERFSDETIARSRAATGYLHKPNTVISTHYHKPNTVISTHYHMPNTVISAHYHMHDIEICFKGIIDF